MFDYLFIKGCIIGFFIAMPVGPIGILCIQHSLTRGMTCGLAAGLGAALADTGYGALAAGGITVMAHILISHQLGIQILGAIFLCWFGIKTLKSANCENDKPIASYSLKRIFMTTFLLTLTNPLTFLGFAGLYAGLGIGFEEESLLSCLLLSAGIFIGSSAWWALLSCSASAISKKINYKSTYFFQKLSGGMILSSGFLTSLSVFHQTIL